MNQRSLQVLSGDGTTMTEAEYEQSQPEEVSEIAEDVLPELTFQERQDALKKSRWNVFLYLGIAVILFGFAVHVWPYLHFRLSTLPSSSQ